MTTIIDFESEQNIAIFNPRISNEDKEFFNQILKTIDNNQSLILVATSGTTTTAKIAAIKKHSFLAAADSVNQFLGASKNDIWLNPLPLFHVGGLAIAARSWLSSASLLSFSNWNVVDFHNQLLVNNVTHTSLVPTQLFDITEGNLHPPQSLKAVLIGGGLLPNSVAKKALALGWQIINTFGMTESSAMLAARIVTKELLVDDQYLFVKPLPHVEWNITQDNLLSIKSPCLFEGYFEIKDNKVSYTDPKQNGWFVTDDYFEQNQDFIKPLGRSKNTIKINGELLNLDSVIHKISKKLDDESIFHSTIFPIPDNRSENKIILALEGKDAKPDLLSIYNSILPPYAQISDTFICDAFPRNTLGKIMTQELKNQYLYDRNKKNNTSL
jgi:O-succinylbenzoic acid--CoA ligase